MDDRINDLAMQIFLHMAAHHTVRHGAHQSRGHAAELARESFKLAQAFGEELEAQQQAAKNEEASAASAR